MFQDDANLEPTDWQPLISSSTAWNNQSSNPIRKCLLCQSTNNLLLKIIIPLNMILLFFCFVFMVGLSLFHTILPFKNQKNYFVLMVKSCAEAIRDYMPLHTTNIIKIY